MHHFVHAALQACLTKVSLLKDVRPSTAEVAGGRGWNEVLHKNMLVAFHCFLRLLCITFNTMCICIYT